MQTKKQTITFPVSEPNPLIKIPEKIPMWGFLGGDDGGAIDKEIKEKYKGISTLQITKYEEGVIKRSNPPYVVAVNQIIREQGLITATQADLENILSFPQYKDALRGFYEDTALVLRSRDNPNTYLAKPLADQIYLRNPKQRMPVIVSLCDLELEADNNSPNKFVFRLRDGSKIIYAPILNKPGNFSSEDINKKTGLPKKTGGGNRTLYTGESGLSRLDLDRDLGLDSDWGNLAGSGSGGRVVVISGEATAQNLKNRIINKIKTRHQIQLKELNDKRDKALSIIEQQK